MAITPRRQIYRCGADSWNERLRYTDKFEDSNLPGEMQVTVTLKAVSVGTEVNNIVQEGCPTLSR